VAPSQELSIHALMKSGLVLAGLLLLVVGLGDVVVGRTKMFQYQETLAQTPASAVDPPSLFATASEGKERRSVTMGKLAFYQLLVNVGQLMVAGGFTLIALGVLRVSVGGARAPTNLPSSR